jgi:hypothetical protein
VLRGPSHSQSIEFKHLLLKACEKGFHNRPPDTAVPGCCVVGTLVGDLRPLQQSNCF